jgi:hypothetical protein
MEITFKKYKVPLETILKICSGSGFIKISGVVHARGSRAWEASHRAKKGAISTRAKTTTKATKAVQEQV